MRLPRPALPRLSGRPQPQLRRPFASATRKPNNRVKIIEVGPRDGLQNEKTPVGLATKIELLRRLVRTGVSAVEAGAFVSPQWVPQMANTSEILSNILHAQMPTPVPITYSLLVPNMKGMNELTKILDTCPNAFSNQGQVKFARRFNVKPAIEVAVFTAATESFSKRNTNASIQESLAKIKEVITKCKELELRVRAYISVVLGCPFEGPDVNPEKVAEIARDLLEFGADEISLGDTTGMGTAPRTSQLLKRMEAAGIRNQDVAMHFHDTYGQALVNTAVSLDHGIRKFDSSVGGLGGCPYSPGATGNVATENMVYMMHSLGMETGIDLDAMADIGNWITNKVGRANDSTVGKAILGARAKQTNEAAGSDGVAAEARDAAPEV